MDWSTGAASSSTRQKRHESNGFRCRRPNGRPLRPSSSVRTPADHGSITEGDRRSGVGACPGPGPFVRSVRGAGEPGR
ncbi:hypothetical protein [Ornithinimicrobium kibberense]|uniref:hypothetical protein n=1 Tax=Ornithinimicrobium kibberense TaxID=282060 RepID=UPI00360E4EFA